jgi:ACS family glucarate transporter-like MFS transporter
MSHSPLAAPSPGLASAKATGGRLVFLLTLAASVGYLCRVNITVVAPRLMAELNLSQLEMGKVFSAFLLGYTLFQVPSGWLAGRVPTRRLFCALAFGWAAITCAHGLVGKTYFGLALGALPGLLGLRFALGILASPTYPAAARVIWLSLPPERQGSANGTVLASIGLGSAVTPPLLGFVTLHWGWRAALLVAALLAILVAMLWWRLAPQMAVSSAARPPSREAAATTGKSPLGLRSFWFLTASYTLHGYVGYVFVFWFFLYIVQVRHFAFLRAAWLTTLPWIASLIVIPLGGVVSDWAVKRWGSTWGRRSLPLPAMALAAGALLLGARTSSAWLAALSLTAATALVLATEGPYWASMTQLSGPQSGIGGGVMNFGSNLGGLISPVLTPWLAAQLGWETALALAAIIAVVGAILWMGITIDPGAASGGGTRDRMVGLAPSGNAREP